MKVSSICPAKARDWIVETPIVLQLAPWKTAAKPSISRRIKGLTASGVTSRGAKPVPPVEMIRSTSGSATQAFTCAWMASTLSVTIALPASSCPAACSRSARKAPDLSVSSVRVSETVSTAIRNG